MTIGKVEKTKSLNILNMTKPQNLFFFSF